MVATLRVGTPSPNYGISSLSQCGLFSTSDAFHAFGKLIIMTRFPSFFPSRPFTSTFSLYFPPFVVIIKSRSGRNEGGVPTASMYAILVFVTAVRLKETALWAYLPPFSRHQRSTWLKAVLPASRPAKTRVRFFLPLTTRIGVLSTRVFILF
ncbi:hypothetical protein BDM02DRAFT_2275397 [Thelephora ganbajun]|uniref:Uncharacterized protein n=1 Tax=Thelephora ganbajun TaxID=370292 RepID=A0ACB6ZGF4_THEGA|nr:hypothetical protein BDM02DRAFT_2275397 [Thelephora ganbajun]